MITDMQGLDQTFAGTRCRRLEPGKGLCKTCGRTLRQRRPSWCPCGLAAAPRLKIVEVMAVGKAIVYITVGAEGIEAIPGGDLLIEHQPEAFADAVTAC